jgi:4-hydroxy-3-methylbut-2-en-1-yl diphosphate synthase IspG/GcpE
VLPHRQLTALSSSAEQSTKYLGQLNPAHNSPTSGTRPSIPLIASSSALALSLASVRSAATEMTFCPGCARALSDASASEIRLASRETMQTSLPFWTRCFATA